MRRAAIQLCLVGAISHLLWDYPQQQAGDGFRVYGSIDLIQWRLLGGTTNLSWPITADQPHYFYCVTTTNRNGESIRPPNVVEPMTKLVTPKWK